jgi:ribonuclease R
MPSETLSERVLQFLGGREPRARSLDNLAEAMGVGDSEMGDFHAACRALMKTGRVVLGAKGTVTLPPPPDRITGRFRANPKGFGFVIPDEPNSHGDLFIPPDAASGALTGDTVAARVQKRGKRDGEMRYEGRIVEILRRGQSRFVGELFLQGSRWFIIPEGNTLHLPIIVGDPGAKGASPGDQVVVEITSYPRPGTDARGVIVKVLGPRGEPGVETQSVIEQFDLPGEFASEVVEEARHVAAAFDAKQCAAQREDLRRLTTITIDPVDARDFDDAISLTKGKDGAVELGVHIADVAHFVHEGGAMDLEARERSNSIYLPRHVIPMLPEVLSNGVCSLQEGQPRLAKSAFITYDAQAQVRSARFANTIIESARRLTYEQATAALEDKRKRKPTKVDALLADMADLARRIRARRLKQGMLELELPAVELVFDNDGLATDVRAEDTSFSHKIIEMFMVEANEAVARLFTDIDIPHLRRIHDEPRKLADGSLRKFLAVLGHVLPPRADRATLQKLLDEVRGRDDAFAVNLAILKSMARAEYSPARVGHFALASEAYSHFTSPIRRYPDLAIHRLLDQYLRGELSAGNRTSEIWSEAELMKLGKQCTQHEERAENAEGELKLVLILKLLEKQIGESFDGIVTGIANMGLFVQLNRYLVDGLVRFESLADDWWEIDESRGCVVGQRGGRRITVGDRMKVVISRIHVPTRRLELAPEGGKVARPGAASPKKHRSGVGKRAPSSRGKAPVRSGRQSVAKSRPRKEKSPRRRKK